MAEEEMVGKDAQMFIKIRNISNQGFDCRVAITNRRQGRERRIGAKAQWTVGGEKTIFIGIEW